MEILPKEIIEIIQLDLDKEYLSPVKTSQNPTGHILGGQPASGKSSLIQRIKAEHPGHSMVVINGDELRRYHPRFNQLNQTDDTKTADLTQPFANSLAQYLQARCIESRKSFIIEGTMRNAQVSIDTAQKLSKANFRVHAHVLAVPIEMSLLRSYQRYLNSVHLHGNGRFSNVTTQLEAFNNLAHSADELKKNVYSLDVYSKDASMKLASFSQLSVDLPSKVIKTEQANINTERKIDIALEWASLYAQMKAIDRNDTFPLEQIKSLLKNTTQQQISAIQLKEITTKTGITL